MSHKAGVSTEAKPMRVFLVRLFVSVDTTYFSAAPASNSTPSGQRSLRQKERDNTLNISFQQIWKEVVQSVKEIMEKSNF